MEEFDYLFENDIDDDDIPLLRLQKRYIRDVENPLHYYEEDEFIKRYKFTKNCVTNILLPLISDDLQSRNQRGLPVLPLLQLLIALRFYATNSFQIVHGDLRSFSQPTISRIVKRVSVAFAERLGQHVKFPEQRNDSLRNMVKFYNIAHFPRVAGCIDCTHIAITNPGGPNAEVFRNRKGWFSMNVQVVVGPKTEILDIVVRHPGSTHDSVIYNRSALRAHLHLNQIEGLLIGDNGYACTNKLLTPFLNPQNEHEEHYNIAHIATRNIVERFFGIWKRRFYCLKSVMRTSLNTTIAIICSTAVLYNLSLIHNQNFILDEEDPQLMPLPVGINYINNNEGGLAYRQAFAHTHF